MSTRLTNAIATLNSVAAVVLGGIALTGGVGSVLGVVAAAIITPSGDPLTLMMLATPMYIFYEIAILFGWWYERRRRKAAEAAEA